MPSLKGRWMTAVLTKSERSEQGVAKVKSEGMSYGMHIALAQGDRTAFCQMWDFMRSCMQVSRCCFDFWPALTR